MPTPLLPATRSPVAATTHIKFQHFRKCDKELQDKFEQRPISISYVSLHLTFINALNQADSRNSINWSFPKYLDVTLTLREGLMVYTCISWCDERQFSQQYRLGDWMTQGDSLQLEPVLRPTRQSLQVEGRHSCARGFH